MKPGITRKFFLFTSLLVTGVLLITCAVLYFAMPSYYLSHKGRVMAESVDMLASDLSGLTDEEGSIARIASFARANNADVMVFDQADRLMPTYSTPFVSMHGTESYMYYISDQSMALQQPDSIQIQISEWKDTASAGVGADAGGGALPGGEGAYSSVEGMRLYETGIASEAADDMQSFTIRIAQAVPTTQASAVLVNSSAATVMTEREVNAPLIGRVLISSTLQPIDEAKDVILSLIPYLLLVSLAVGLILAYLYARRFTRPIVAISDATVRMRDMNVDAHSGIRTRDELGQLSENLDAMYERLLETIEDLRGQMDRANRLELARTEFMQATGHELKTPLAALSGVVEGMLDNVGVYKDRETYLRESKQLIDRLTRLVHEILSASRTDMAEREPLAVEVSLEAQVERALEPQVHLLRDKALTLTKTGLDKTVHTDPELFYRALANLMANAARYTPQGGSICVRAVEEGDGMYLEIKNDHPLIPEEELERLFEPFYTRSYSRDRSRSGTGLGLYIVRRALSRLDMPITVVNTEGGLLFRIRLSGGADQPDKYCSL